MHDRPAHEGPKTRFLGPASRAAELWAAELDSAKTCVLSAQQQMTHVVVSLLVAEAQQQMTHVVAPPVAAQGRALRPGRWWHGPRRLILRWTT